MGRFGKRVLALSRRPVPIRLRIFSVDFSSEMMNLSASRTIPTPIVVISTSAEPVEAQCRRRKSPVEIPITPPVPLNIGPLSGARMYEPAEVAIIVNPDPTSRHGQWYIRLPVSITPATMVIVISKTYVAAFPIQ